MNPTDRNENDPRAISLIGPASIPGLAGGVPGAPKSRDPEQGPGSNGARELRNLLIGVGLLMVGLFIFWMGLYLPDHIAVLAIVASLGAGGLIWFIQRSGLLRQPHGTVIAIGVTFLFGASVPFIERGFRKLDGMARVQLGAGQVAPGGDGGAAPIAPVPPGPADRKEPPAPVAAATAKEPADDVVRELVAAPPDAAAGKVIRLKQDQHILISGRKFLVRAGDRFPFKKFSDGAVTFLANGEEVTVDAALVTFTGKSQESPAEITKLATEELRKRYPGIFEKGSEQNDIFVARTEELKSELPEFFKNPRWPLELAEQLAGQQGWSRADHGAAEKESSPPKGTPTEAPPQQAPE